MTARLKVTCALSITGSNVLSAQASLALHPQTPDVDNAVRLVEQNALFALIGAVVLIGIAWLCYVVKACARLNKPPENSRRGIYLMLLLVTGLSAFFGSCSAEQRAMATQYHADAAASYRTCPVQHHYANQPAYPLNAKFVFSGNSDWYGYRVCKYCSQRYLNKGF